MDSSKTLTENYNFILIVIVLKSLSALVCQIISLLPFHGQTRWGYSEFWMKLNCKQMTFSTLNSEQVLDTSEVWFLKQTFLHWNPLYRMWCLSLWAHTVMSQLFQPCTLWKGNRKTCRPMSILNASLWLQQQTTVKKNVRIMVLSAVIIPQVSLWSSLKSD